MPTVPTEEELMAKVGLEYEYEGLHGKFMKEFLKSIPGIHIELHNVVKWIFFKEDVTSKQSDISAIYIRPIEKGISKHCICRLIGPVI